MKVNKYFLCSLILTMLVVSSAFTLLDVGKEKSYKDFTEEEKRAWNYEQFLKNDEMVMLYKITNNLISREELIELCKTKDLNACSVWLN